MAHTMVPMVVGYMIRHGPSVCMVCLNLRGVSLTFITRVKCVPGIFNCPCSYITGSEILILLINIINLVKKLSEFSQNVRLKESKTKDT